MDEESREDGESSHRVTLTKGYWLGQYEVTEAQWEYGCRAGTTPPFSFGGY